MSQHTIIEINHEHIPKIQIDPADFADRLIAAILNKESDEKAKMLAKVQLEALGVRCLCKRHDGESLHIMVDENHRYMEAVKK